MTGLSLEGLTKRFGNLTAVDHVDLKVAQGTFVCLLGPSGCGKTTLLRMIAGLEEPSEGRIALDGTDIIGVPAHRRDFGMVFQSLALFPHLNVGGNIAYPLRIRGAPASEQRERTAALLDLVHLPGFADRPIAKLSGGQRQRVAIARALALSPRLFLLDEPLSALDAKLREAMQVELRQLQERLGITTIVVTHDQREAMTMADLVVVMGDGKVLQAGSPIDIYRKPANAFVASFIGSTNLIPATPGSGGAVVPGGLLPGLALAGDAATISVRPEDIELAGPAAAAMRGKVTFVRDLGATIEVFIHCAGTEIIAVETPRNRRDLRAGDEVGIVIDPAHAVVLKP
jgi:putative spermidine/putrescine transport system ATP-binding protein